MLLAYRTNDTDKPSSSSSSSSNIMDETTTTTTTTTTTQRTIIPKKDQTPTPIALSIRRVAGPFAMASLGSLVGCWISYQCAVQWNWLAPASSARVATGCLAASYIGGSVNFFAAAKLLQAPADLLSSMAAADLLAMALYFSILDWTLEWKWLKSKFHQETPSLASSSVSVSSEEEEETQQERPHITSSELLPTTSLRSQCLASVPLLGLTWAIVRLANGVEGVLGRWVPGVACAVIALVAPLVNSWASKTSRVVWWGPMADAASVLADVSFLTFFASIGMGANLLQSTLQMGPACLLFSLVALLVHLLVAVIGSSLLFSASKSGGGGGGVGVELEDVWIASNAAIGGPATAAAFCNRMRKNSTSNAANLRGRTLAATVWGVVGYAIGTTLGVTLYRAIGGTILS
jgi:uncharacterized membrane protein